MLRYSRFYKRDSIHKMAGKINRVGTSRPSTASRVAAAKAARAAAVASVGGVRRAESVDEFSRPESPASIAINYSDLSAFGDGMTLSQYRLMMAALPERFHDRITSGETLAVRWLETRTPREMALYPDIVRTAHWIMSRAFSTAVIEPGVTTADDYDVEFFRVKHGTPPPGGWAGKIGMSNYSGNRFPAFCRTRCFT